MIHKKNKKIGGLLQGITIFYLFICIEVLLFDFARTYIGNNTKFLVTFLSYLGLGLLLKIVINIISKKDKSELFEDGLIQFIFSGNSIFVLLPTLIYFVAVIISGFIHETAFYSVSQCFLNLTALILFSAIYDEALKRLLFNTVYVKYQVKENSLIWISFVTVAISYTFILFSLYIFGGTLPNIQLMICLLLIEVFSQINYVSKSTFYSSLAPKISRYIRINLIFIAFGPCCIDTTVTLQNRIVPIWFLWFYSAILFIKVILFATNYKENVAACYDATDRWDIPKDRLYNLNDLDKVRGKRNQIKIRLSEETKILSYFIGSVIFCGISFFIHYLCHHFSIFPIIDCSVDFVRNNGIDLLTTMISCTFLIISFLSFLGDRNDKVLWTDMRTFRLINPPIFNFISLAVFSFASLFFGLICYFLKYDYLFLISFSVCLLFLTYLTFLVIISYFKREETIDKLTEYAISTFLISNKENQWTDIYDDLYENTCKLIEEKDWGKLAENYHFLVELCECIRKAVIKLVARKVLEGCSVKFDSKSELMYSKLRQYLELGDSHKSMDNIVNIYDATVNEIIRMISAMDNTIFAMLVKKDKSGVYFWNKIMEKEPPRSENKKITVGCDEKEKIIKEYSEQIEKSVQKDSNSIKEGVIVRKRYLQFETSFGSVIISLNCKKETKKDMKAIYEFWCSICEKKFDISEMLKMINQDKDINEE